MPTLVCFIWLWKSFFATPEFTGRKDVTRIEFGTTMHDSHKFSTHELSTAI